VAEDAISYARTKGLDVYCRQFDDAFVAEMGPFDTIVMLDVIEHLDDPRKVLTNAHRALAKHGSVMITTGDWGSLVARITGRHWRLMTPPQHLFFFSIRNLTALLNRCGFQVVECTRPWKYVPLGLVMYQSMRCIGLRIPRVKVLNQIGIPVNLFDAVRIVARKA
jgi:SAM-dependent methyltransferase